MLKFLPPLFASQSADNPLNSSKSGDGPSRSSNASSVDYISLTIPIFTLPEETIFLPGAIYRLALDKDEISTLVSTVFNTGSPSALRLSNEAKEGIKLVRSIWSEMKANSSSGKQIVLRKHGLNGSRIRDISSKNFSGEDGVNRGLFEWLVFGCLPGKSQFADNADQLYGTIAMVTSFSERIAAGSNKYIVNYQAMLRFKVDEYTRFGNDKQPIEAKITVYLDTKSSLTGNLEYNLVRSCYNSSLDLFGYIDEFLTNYKQLKASNKSLLATSLYVRFLSQKALLEKLRSILKNLDIDSKVEPNLDSLIRFTGVIDLLSTVLPLKYSDKLKILAAVDVTDRLNTSFENLEDLISLLRVCIDSTEYVFSGLTEIQKRALIGTQLGLLQSEMKKSSSSTNKKNNGKLGSDSDIEDEDEELAQINKFVKNLKNLNIPEEGKKIIIKESSKLRRMNPSQSEYQVGRNYLETLMDIPWSELTNSKIIKNNSTDNEEEHVISIESARKQLDDDHYGLDKVKKRLLQYLAVLQLHQHFDSEKEVENSKKLKTNSIKDVNSNNASTSEDEEEDPAFSKALLKYSNLFDISDDSSEKESKTEIIKVQPKPEPSKSKAPILLLVGPPGVGKTSLAKSIAAALGRKFHRISLGGVRDEAEIRGHRRTYVGAMPGIMIQGLRKVGVMNPVILLDEIDKICGNDGGAKSIHGDPSAAMLEVLDPEQNSTFTDHYIGFPVDLSQVIFIATANYARDIAAPLYDRMEVIEIEGYTYFDKTKIAKQYLLPKQIKLNGLNDSLVNVDDEALMKIATCYTREAGVRNLERELASICRGKAVEYAESLSSSTPIYNGNVTMEDLYKYIGMEKYDDTLIEPDISLRNRMGLVNGLAYMGSGNGGILIFEAIAMPGNGNLKLTGQLGDVIQESAQLSMSFVKANLGRLGIETNLELINIHLHVPDGAVPKDGPSAGSAITMTLLSLLTKTPVPSDLAMTGEMTLRGKILPVGGIREKLLGAHLAGVTKVLLPIKNKRDVAEMDGEKFVKQELDIDIQYVDTIWDVISLVWGKNFINVIDDENEGVIKRQNSPRL